jgi:hypothetical protein
MTSPIDPIRRPQSPRRPRKASVDQTEERFDTESANLPVPVAGTYRTEPPHPTHGGASIEAQILGQTGARRGLRAGPAVIDTAQHAYNKTEWSGKNDRRAPKGGVAKTDV